MRRFRALVGATLCVAAVLFLLAGPAGAQQLVDAGGDNGQGGLAFVLMALMVFAIAGSLFYMDHVRRNRLPQSEDDATQ